MALLLPSDPPVIKDHPALRDWLKRLLECLKGKLFKAPAGTGYIHITDGVMDDPAQPIPPTSLPDGNYGDVTVGGGGTSIELNPDVVGNAELRNSGPLSVIGNPTNVAGDPSDISTPSGSGHFLRELGGVLTFSPLPAAPGIPPNSITNVELRDSAARSVMGNPTAVAGDPTDIIATVDGTVLQRLGTIIGFFGLSGGQLADGSIDYIKIVPQPVSTLLGRGDSAGSGPPEVITLGTMLQIIGTELQVLFPSLSIPNNFVSNAMLRDSIALSVMGRSVNLSGDPADIATTAASNAVLRELGSVIGWGLLTNVNLSASAGITRGQLAIGSSLSVVGRAANTPGAVADIIAASGSGAVLRELGGSIGWGQLATGGIADKAVTDAKLRDSAATSVLGRAGSTPGSPADIVAASGGSGVLKENGAGALFFGLINNNNVAANALIAKSKLENSSALSVVGRAVNAVGTPSDIAAASNGQMLMRNADALAFVTPNLQTTLFTKVYDGPAMWGELAVAGTPTMALTNPTVFSTTLAGGWFAGHLLGDTKITWLGFSFCVPADISAAVVTPRICLILNSAGAGQIDIDIVGSIFNDNDFSTAGTAFSVATIVTFAGHGASDYLIVDLNALGVNVTAGQRVNGVIQRDARVANASDTYADLVGVAWISFRADKKFL
jgi:hypothetical protein